MSHLAACSHDLASGLTAYICDCILMQKADGQLLHFERLGWLAIAASLESLWIFQ